MAVWSNTSERREERGDPGRQSSCSTAVHWCSAGWEGTGRKEGGLQTAVEGQLTPSTSTLHTRHYTPDSRVILTSWLSQNWYEAASRGVEETNWGFLIELRRIYREQNYEARIDCWTESGGQQTDEMQISETKEKNKLQLDVFYYKLSTSKFYMIKQSVENL